MANLTDPFPLSNSQADVFNQCPEKWYLLYQDKLSIPSSPALEFGIDLHKILSKCLEAMGDHFAPNFYLENIIADEWGQFIEYGKQVYTFHMVLQMIQSSIDVLAAIGVDKILAVEKSIGVDWFRGILDLCFVDTNGKTWVWDWKTTSSKYTEDSLRNQTQLIGYCYLFHEEFGYYPDYVGLGAIHKKDLDCTGYQMVRTSQDIMDWVTQTRDTYERIWQSEIRYKDSKRCNDYFVQCPFFERCWGKREVKVILPAESNQF